MFAAAFTVVIFFCLPRIFHAEISLESDWKSVSSRNWTVVEASADPRGVLEVPAATPPLAPPPNVTMETLNTNYILRWDWDQSWSQDVNFTTEYMGSFRKARVKRVCANQSRRSCDLSEAGLYYFGKYLVRVRAEANGSHSEWAQLTFLPDKEARVGPPSRVDLSHVLRNVDVRIHDPVTHDNKSMRTLVENLFYNIRFWEDPPSPQSSQVRNISSNANLVTLPDLKAGTRYCVEVQTREKYFQKESSFTSPVCIRTLPGATVWWVPVLFFLVSMVTVSLLGLCIYKSTKWVKSVFCPASQLPSHFKEYLLDSPGSDKPRLLTSEAEQLCDEVVVCPRSFPEEQLPPPVVVAAPPCCLEAECSHQGGNRDSGVYSSDSGSFGFHPIRQQSSTGSDVFWTDLCDLDKPKMDARTAGLLVGVSDVRI